MKLIELTPHQLILSDDLRRSGSAKQFEERLRSSIEEIGLVEPLKVALMPSGQYLVVDGTMRLRAIQAIREADGSAFEKIPAYTIDYERRYEIRYQTDIYQDLMPSQLAAMVEHLHRAEGVHKTDVARYIGVAPSTLRNYTGLWRLMQRGGLFARIVDLMDAEVMPSSNPYAWLRLTDEGLRLVLETHIREHEERDDAEDGKNGPQTVESWFDSTILAVKRGQSIRYTTGYVETITNGLDDKYYREDAEVRNVKKDLGLRRAAAKQLGATAKPSTPRRDRADAVRHLNRVSRDTKDPVLRAAARSFQEYLR